MWLNKYILKVLLITNLVLISCSKIKSNVNSANYLTSGSTMIQTNSLIVYQDKEATNKLFTFEGINFDLEKADKYFKGLKIDLNQMKNKESADNFFKKIAKNLSSGIYFIFFSSFSACDVIAKKNPAINLYTVQMAITGQSSETFYLALSFFDGEASVDKYSKLIYDECKNYSGILKKKLNDFYKAAKEYFKVKKEKENLKSKSADLDNNNSKEAVKLDNATTEKKIQDEKIKKDKEELDKSIKEKNNLESDLKTKYSDLNTLKAEKAKMEKTLEELKKSSDAINKESETQKNKLDEIDKQKEENRVQLNVQSSQLTDAQKKIGDMEKLLNDKKEEVKKFFDDLNVASGKVIDTQASIAKNKNRINQEQKTVDDIKNVNNEESLKEKTKIIDELDKQLKALRKDLSDINNQIEESDRNVKKGGEELKNLLNDPINKINLKKEEVNKLMEELKDYLDNTKKLFPLLPDIYWDNIWRFVSVNHSEALNYLKGMRPSIFGLYDNLYTNAHPEQMINDVDFNKKDVPIVIGKSKKLKKKKF